MRPDREICTEIRGIIFYCHENRPLFLISNGVFPSVTWDAGSIPEYVTGIFHKPNHSGRPLEMGSTKPLTEISTTNISWGGKGGQCLGLTLPPSCVNYHEIWQPQTHGNLKACPVIYRCHLTLLAWDCPGWSPICPTDNSSFGFFKSGFSRVLWQTP
jgi:hypothetical protein